MRDFHKFIEEISSGQIDQEDENQNITCFPDSGGDPPDNNAESYKSLNKYL